MFYKSYSLQDLENKNISKRELVSIMGIESETFDYALPQTWLDDFVDKNFDKVTFETSKGANDKHLTRNEFYSLVLSTTVWVYPKGSAFGGAISGCTEVAVRLPAIGCRWTEKDFAA